jgi:hypothetical protein
MAWSARVQEAENRLNRLEQADCFVFTGIGGRWAAAAAQQLDGGTTGFWLVIELDEHLGLYDNVAAEYSSREEATAEAERRANEGANKEEAYEASSESNDEFHSSSLDSEEI